MPVLAVAFGQIRVLVLSSVRLSFYQWVEAAIYVLTVFATLFLFYVQDIKNGMAYAALCLVIFLTSLFFGRGASFKSCRRAVLAILVLCSFATVLYPHVKKNDSWKTLVADAKVAFQLDRYQHWKYAGEQGYPNNEFGQMVSVTNYERAAWFKVGLQLSTHDPLGYGLIEDSFKRMAKARWPEVSPNLSHSHSGWLDVVLGFGYPGFLLIISALLIVLKSALSMKQPWAILVFWPLLANLLLWCTTEVSATVTFAALIFWICLGSGLILIRDPLVDAVYGDLEYFKPANPNGVIRTYRSNQFH